MSVTPRAMNCALRDADGNVRLTFNRHLPREPRSLLTAITSYKADSGGRWYTKDNRTDHAIDALRMVVADLMPVQQGPAVEIVRRAG